jgi:molybdopterin converting factor small subunit
LEIEVELFGQLAPENTRKQTLNVETNCIAREVAEFLKLDPGKVGLVTIDGVQQKMDFPLTAGCRLCFFPPMSGG